MAGGQWEVVGGKSKKTKPKNEGPKSSKDKKAKENPAFETSGPISESQTLFSAFLEKEKKEIPKPKITVSETVKEKEKNMQSKKKKEKKPTAPSSKVKLEKLFHSVTTDDVKNLLVCIQDMCPEPNHIWLRDLVSFLNLKFDAPIEDVTFSDKPIGYPCILLNKGVYDLILKTFKRFKMEKLEVFFEFCVQNMVQDSLKGLNTVGYRVVIQCLAQEMPSIVTEKLAKCTELCDSHQNRQNICLSVFWAAGQAGNNNLEAGLRVWMSLMFRAIGSKTCTNYAIEYLEKLLSSDEFLKCSKSILSVSDLFPILDSVYSKDLGKNVQKRLLALYPTLKTLSYGPKPEDVAHNFFPSYLRRLEPDCPANLKEELLSSLVYCLEKDVQTYRIWRHIYTKHFVQSKLLIAHINEQWENLRRKLNKKGLFDTLSVFQVTNEEQLNTGKRIPIVEECVFITKELLHKVRTQGFSWFRLTLLFILIFSTMLTIDILIHNSFVESNIGKFMRDSGLIVIFAQAGEKLVYYYGKVHKLLQVYFPVAMKWCETNVLPHIDSFWRLLSKSFVSLWRSSSEIRMWCNTNIQAALILVDQYFPVYAVKIITVVNDIVLLLLTQLKIVLVYMWQHAQTLVVWLQSNSSVVNSLEAIRDQIINLCGFLQEHVVSLANFIYSHLPSLT